MGCQLFRLYEKGECKVKRYRGVSLLLAAVCAVSMLGGCGKKKEKADPVKEASSVSEASSVAESASESVPSVSNNTVSQNTVSNNSVSVNSVSSNSQQVGVAATPTPSAASNVVTSQTVSFNPSWQYAGNSKIHSGTATLYKAASSVNKGKTVCVNAGHGTKGGESVRTLCHPDGTPKVTGGSTDAGATTAMAVASGTTLDDGTEERTATLALALKVKDRLLAEGYNVLMIRETDDVQLDNIARTLMANNLADCHISLHYDSTQSDKGAYYMGPADVSSYLSMEPVASHHAQHDQLGNSIISGLKSSGVKIWDSGRLGADLTQTSYSTVPSIDLEVGDRASDHSDSTLTNIANGIASGLNTYFGLPATTNPATGTTVVQGNSAAAGQASAGQTTVAAPTPAAGAEGVG